MSDSPLRVPDLPVPAVPWRPGRAPRPPEPVLIGSPGKVVRHGADLFDHGAWWEAHAVWEAEWRAQPLGSGERHALQGLIQVAAYHLKDRPHLRVAAGRLKARALEHLDAALRLGPPRLYGLDLVRLRDDLEQHGPGSSPLRLHPAPAG
ncbi:MAG: DUF309 domain-containing protein [Myxococcota bacterium]